MADTLRLLAAPSRLVSRSSLSDARQASDLLAGLQDFQDGTNESQEEARNADRFRAAVERHFDRDWFCETEEEERSSHGHPDHVGAPERHPIARPFSWTRRHGDASRSAAHHEIG